MLLPRSSNKWGGSMNHLDAVPGTMESTQEPKVGLLRRAFSSKKRRKRQNQKVNTGITGVTVNDYSLLVPNHRDFLNCSSWNSSSVSGRSNDDCRQSNDENSGNFFLTLALRGSFSRRNYGSVEMLLNRHMESYINNAGRFRVENGSIVTNSEGRMGSDMLFNDTSWNSNVNNGSGINHTNNGSNVNGHSNSVGNNLCKSTISNPILLENPEQETRWYFKYFLGKYHQVYMGLISEHDPVVVVTVITDLNNNNVNQYRVVIWRKNGSQKLCIPYNSSSPLTIKKILSCFDQLKFEKFPKEIFNNEVQKDVLILEEQEGSVNFKFGVIYCHKGQSSDEDMYNNEHGSPEFEEFLDLLGDKIQLKNWDRYRGGLDVKNDTTGTSSYYTIYEGHEIMFHVSTLLPMTSDNRQQIERKRHIGNDIVNIIFIDDVEDDNLEQIWTPSMMKTHFTHIFAIVTYVKSKEKYRLSVYSEESVPLFGPPLPHPAEFSNKFEFREFLLVKLINGEKASFNTPVFGEKRERTMEMLLQNILQQYTLDCNHMLNRRAFSDIVLDHGNGISTSKEMTRNEEFIKYGQMLKVNIIIKGDAPTSAITTRLAKRMPWQPRIFVTDLNYSINCGDSWGEKMVLGTERGTLLLEENTAAQLLIEKGCDVKQIQILENIGVMIVRCDKGRDSRIAIIQLLDLKKPEIVPMLKGDMKKFFLDRTRGCHIFELSKPHVQPVRLIVAVGRRLQVYTWKFTTCTSSLSSWNQFTSSSVDPSFQFIRELPTFEIAQVLTIIESNYRGVFICIGYRGQFDLIHEKTGDTIHLYHTEYSPKSNSIMEVLDLCSEDEPELLLCYNRSCHFQKIRQENQVCDNSANSDADFSWNFEPENIVLALPYVLAFAHNAIEIRLVVNGNLVHTMSVPNCKLITSKIDLFFYTTADNLSKELIEKQHKYPLANQSMITNNCTNENTTATILNPNPGSIEKATDDYVFPMDSSIEGPSLTSCCTSNPLSSLTNNTVTQPSTNAPSNSVTSTSSGMSLSLSQRNNSVTSATANSTNPRKHIYRIPISTLSGSTCSDDSCHDSRQQFDIFNHNYHLHNHHLVNIHNNSTTTITKSSNAINKNNSNATNNASNKHVGLFQKKPQYLMNKAHSSKSSGTLINKIDFTNCSLTPPT